MTLCAYARLLVVVLVACTKSSPQQAPPPPAPPSPAPVDAAAAVDPPPLVDAAPPPADKPKPTGKLITEDAANAAFVTPDGRRVDLYALLSASIVALQAQDARIKALEARCK